MKIKYVKVPIEDIEAVEEARKNLHKMWNNLSLPEENKNEIGMYITLNVSDKLFRLTHKNYKKVVLF